MSASAGCLRWEERRASAYMLPYMPPGLCELGRASCICKLLNIGALLLIAVLWC